MGSFRLEFSSDFTLQHTNLVAMLLAAAYFSPVSKPRLEIAIFS